MATSTNSRGLSEAPPRASPHATALGATVRSPFAIPVVAGLFALLHHGWGSPEFDASARWGAAALGTLLFLIVRNSRPDRIPFMALAAVQFYVFFGAATFTSQRLMGARGPLFVSTEARTYAVWAAVLALSFMWAGARATFPLGVRLRPLLLRFAPPARVVKARSAIRAWAVLSVLVRVVTMGLGPARAAETAYIANLVAAPILVQALLYYETASSRTAVSKVWFWGFTVTISTLGLSTGMLSAALYPIFSALVLGWLRTGRVRVAPIVVLLGLYVLLTPAKFAFRQQVWNPSGRSAVQVSYMERATIWWGAIGEAWGDERADIDENLEGSKSRVSEIMFVAQTFDWVPTYVPYSGFARWQMIFYSYIPRVLWPAKPDLTRVYNHAYAMTFGLMSEEATRTTAINLPLVTDGFWSFGWPGVALVGLLVGLLFGVYEGVFDPSVGVALAMGLPLLVGMQATAHLATLYTGILQSMVSFLVALWVIQGVAFVLTARRR